MTEILCTGLFCFVFSIPITTFKLANFESILKAISKPSQSHEPPELQFKKILYLFFFFENLLGFQNWQFGLLSWYGCLTHGVISDKVHRLLVTLSYFRPDRFVQLLSLIPILILLLYLLVSIDLKYTGLLRVGLLEKATKL